MPGAIPPAALIRLTLTKREWIDAYLKPSFPRNWTSSKSLKFLKTHFLTTYWSHVFKYRNWRRKNRTVINFSLNWISNKESKITVPWVVWWTAPRVVSITYNFLILSGPNTLRIKFRLWCVCFDVKNRFYLCVCIWILFSSFTTRAKCEPIFTLSLPLKGPSHIFQTCSHLSSFGYKLKLSRISVSLLDFPCFFPDNSSFALRFEECFCFFRQ